MADPKLLDGAKAHLHGRCLGGVDIGRKLAPMIQDGDRVVVVGPWQLEVRHGLAAARRGSGPSNLETLLRSQAAHPGWLDRECLVAPVLVLDARNLDARARHEGQRIWLICSPCLHGEGAFLRVFEGWRHLSLETSPIISVDLLLLAKPAE